MALLSLTRCIHQGKQVYYIRCGLRPCHHGTHCSRFSQKLWLTRIVPVLWSMIRQCRSDSIFCSNYCNCQWLYWVLTTNHLYEQWLYDSLATMWKVIIIWRHTYLYFYIIYCRSLSLKTNKNSVKIGQFGGKYIFGTFFSRKCINLVHFIKHNHQYFSVLHQY